MMIFPPLPLSPMAAPDEPLLVYRARLVRFLLRHDVTATMTDEQLEQARMGIQLAVAGALDDKARDRLVSVQRLLASTVARRTSERAQLMAPVAPIAPTKPNDGPMARLVRPLVTAPIVPAAAVDIPF